MDWRATPDGVRHLIERAQWDADGTRDVLCRYVIQRLGERDVVLLEDETGFVRTGLHPVGVQRQYSSTAGRIENSQIDVFLYYTGHGGSAFVMCLRCGPTIPRAARRRTFQIQ
ncbi:transposase [Paraburkholderia humisilvae]|nr:transposase [Paraburkholderia humisilvae]